MQTSEMRQLWTDFKNAFIKAADEAGKSKLSEAWRDPEPKTIFYKTNMMPRIAEHLAMRHKVERLRRDHTFLDENCVPKVIIECENKHGEAWREMESLCSLAAPLKVLVLSCDWEDTERAIFLPNWIKIIKKHHAVISLDCLYAIIVGEWQDDGCVEYSFTSIDANGNEARDGRHRVIR